MAVAAVLARQFGKLTFKREKKPPPSPNDLNIVVSSVLKAIDTKRAGERRLLAGKILIPIGVVALVVGVATAIFLHLVAGIIVTTLGLTIILTSALLIKIGVKWKRVNEQFLKEDTSLNDKRIIIATSTNFAVIAKVQEHYFGKKEGGLEGADKALFQQAYKVNNAPLMKWLVGRTAAIKNEKSEAGSYYLEEALLQRKEPLAQQLHSLGFVTNADALDLQQAADEGNEQIVEIMLKCAADPDKKGLTGKTPLISAVEKNHKPVVELLLNAAKRLNDGDSTGKTALMVASEHCHIDLMKLLIEKKANIDAIDIFEHSALWHALHSPSERSLEAVTLLCANKASARFADLRKVDRRALEMIVKTMPPLGIPFKNYQAEYNHCIALFNEAIEKDDLPMALLLICKISDPEKKNDITRIALIKEIDTLFKDKSADKARFFLEHNPRLANERDDQRSFLCKAIGNGRLDLVEVLIDCGARMSGEKGETPIQAAILWLRKCESKASGKTFDKKIMEYLLSHGAKISYKDYASMQFNEDIVELFDNHQRKKIHPGYSYKIDHWRFIRGKEIPKCQMKDVPMMIDAAIESFKNFCPTWIPFAVLDESDPDKHVKAYINECALKIKDNYAKK